jgi:hypothetical protein
METIGLYYPYINIRDPNWLKVALLYWPKIARILPAEYREDPFVGDPLKEFGLIVDITPDQSASRVSDRWIRLITSHIDELKKLYGLYDAERKLRKYKPPMPTPLPQWASGTDAAPNSLTWHGTTEVHVNEMTVEARDALVSAGLADFPGLGADGTSNWIVMRAELAWVYKCLLAEDVADSNQLALTTDQSVAHALAGRWSEERMGAYLTGSSSATSAPLADDLGESMGLLALNLVVPADLDSIPIEAAIELRRKHAAEFDAFRITIDGIVQDLGQHISAIEDPAVIQAYIKQAVEEKVVRQLEDLKKQLRGANFEAAGIVANVRFDLPAGVALAAAWADRPAVAGIAAAAAGVLSVRRGIRQQRQKIMQPSAGAYMYHIQHGTPTGALNRSMQRVKWMAGLG